MGSSHNRAIYKCSIALTLGETVRTVCTNELPSARLIKRLEKFSCNVRLLIDYIFKVSTSYMFPVFNFVCILYVCLSVRPSLCLSDCCMSLFVFYLLDTRIEE